MMKIQNSKNNLEMVFWNTFSPDRNTSVVSLDGLISKTGGKLY